MYYLGVYIQLSTNVMQLFNVFLCDFSSGLPSAVPRRLVLRPRRAALLRNPLPRQTRIAVRRMLEADHRTVHHGHVQEVPSRAFCVRLLPEATEQGNVQGAERQAILPWML